MNSLWRGNWRTRIRIASGLVLMAYVLLHFLNIAAGLFGPEAMDGFQAFRQTVTRSVVGTVILYAALLAHMLLALWRLARRRTLRMPVGEAVQTVLGLLIPLALVDHIVFTRLMHEMHGVQDSYGYLINLIFGTQDGMIQTTLLFIVWIHGCMGLHFWLSTERWWRAGLPAFTGFATLVPVLAFLGFGAEGQRLRVAMADPETQQAMFAEWGMPGIPVFQQMISLAAVVWWVVAAVLMAVALAYLLRKLIRRRRSVRITYVDGPSISATKGGTLLEMSRAGGVPHTALCGGRGRCTTCRVIVEEGAELLHPPSATEERSLRAVNAPPNARLACQIRPTDPMTVFRVFQPDGKRGRAHASQGQEQELAVLFLDIRGFTSRTTGQLPYDVVFLLNRFFDAIVPSVTDAGGTVDKYLGDGFLALFETGDARSSAQAGLRAVEGIGTALRNFNAELEAEGTEPVAIGLGLHLGEVVIGEIGATGNAPRTLIGDTVNTASRLEAKTKDLSVQLLVSEAVLRAAGHDPERVELHALDLRGLTEPLPAMSLECASDLSAQLVEFGVASASEQVKSAQSAT